MTDNQTDQKLEQEHEAQQRQEGPESKRARDVQQQQAGHDPAISEDKVKSSSGFDQ